MDRCPGNTASKTSLETRPRYAMVPDQTGSKQGECGIPCFAKRLFLTVDLIPSMPMSRSHVAETPFWKWIVTSSFFSSRDINRWPRWRRPLILFMRVCCKSALWNVVDPPGTIHISALLKNSDGKGRWDDTLHNHVMHKKALFLIRLTELENKS